MQALYYLKWPFLIFFVGLLLNVIGALLKIRHWPGADEILTLGSIAQAVAILLAIIKIAMVKKPNP
jgi:hypothetical protein